MNTNLLLGIVVGGGAVLLGAALLQSASKEKYAEVTSETDEQTVNDEKTFKEKVEEKVINITEKIVESKNQIEAITVAVGLLTALVKLRNAWANYKTPNNFIIFKPDTMKVSDEAMADFIKQLKTDRRILA